MPKISRSREQGEGKRAQGNAMINFKDLIVWQKAMILAEESYLVTTKLPQSELFGLASQMKRSAISIPSNIAEGHKRGTKDYVRFLKIAYGSSAELETQLLLSQKLFPAVHISKAIDLVIEVEKMISTIITKLTNGVE